MRKTLTAAALLLALSCPAFPGEVQNPGAPQPPTTTQSDATAEAGDIALTTDPATTDDVTADGDYTYTLTEIVLTVISVLP